MSTIPFGPPPSRGSSPLQILEDPGVVGGANLDAAPHEIPPGQGRFLKDVLLDVPGIVRQRGPINTKNLFPSLPSNHRVVGLTSLQDPNGTNFFRILLLTVDRTAPNHIYAWFYGHSAVTTTTPFHARSFFGLMEPLDVSGQVHGDLTIYFDDRRGNTTNVGAFQQLLSFDMTTVPGATGLSVAVGANDPYFDAKLAMDGGILLGIGTNYGADSGKASHRVMFRWKGAAKANYARATVTTTQNSPVLTDAAAAFLANVEPGMFATITATGQVVGVVKSVDSNTQVTLEQNITIKAAVSAITFCSFARPFAVPGNTIGSGSVTATTTSAVVNGGGTKFTDQAVAVNDLLFRASDNTYIGQVTSIQSNIQLTLTGNAAVAMNNESYFIVHASNFAAGSEPTMSAYWNGMQLLCQADGIRNGQVERSRIFVSDTHNMDTIDVSKNGTFYDLPNTKPHTDIRAILPTETCCLVFLAEATYGIFGNDPTALSPKVVHSDGALSPMVVAPYQGGAVWAGHRGVYFYDGHSVTNLLENRASRAHQQALANIDYGTYRAWAMLHNAHYTVFLSKVNPGSFKHSQGRANSTDDSGMVTFDPTSIVYTINLRTGSLVFWSNVNVRGYTAPPGVLVTERDSYFVVENAATNGPAIASAEALFQDAGYSGFAMDQIVASPGGIDFAPHFFVEGRLNSFGDVERKKRILMLLAQYSLYGEAAPSGAPGDTSRSKLGVDVVLNMGADTKAVATRARTATSVATPTSWANKRNRFGGARSGLIGYRFYTMADGPPVYAQTGPVSFGLKPMRAGRT